MNKIIYKEKLSENTYLMQIENENIARHALPGNFIILRVKEEGERIPLTISDCFNDIIEITFQALGATTKILSELNVDEEILDLVGPLGKAKEFKAIKKVLGIAGGVGSAPLYPQLKKYNSLGVKTDVLIGARDKENILFQKKYQAFCENLYFSTIDGSFGKKGTVIEILKELDLNTYDEIIIIGPCLMMKSVVEYCQNTKAHLSVSLNPIMIDGTGMCGECRVTVDGKIKFACIDGPDFDGRLVNFEELNRRQRIFKSEEHICFLEGINNAD